MVFNLIDFLLGAKKTGKKSQKNGAQVGNLNNNQQGSNNTQNAQNNEEQDELQFEDSHNQEIGGESNSQTSSSSTQQTQAPTQQSNAHPSAGNAISSISKLHEELKASTEKVGTLFKDFKDLENNVNSMSHRLDDLEEARKTTDEKLSEIDSSMTKFLSLYELVNNQYNPFVDKEASMQQMAKPVPKQVMIGADGNTTSDTQADESSPINPNPDYSPLSPPFPELGESDMDLDAMKKDGILTDSSLPPQSQISSPISSNRALSGDDDMDSAILALDTLDIEEAAADAVPLTRLKNNTNSLVTILSWLGYLVKKVGVEEARNTLRYYTEILRWITPEVFFDLDKYLKGMGDKIQDDAQRHVLGVKDHIVSLYFISKLNEKALDEKLTRAVIKIIKQ